MPDVERPPTGLGISHVGLSVRDLERSLAFYCDVLGARVVRPPYDSVRGRFRMAVIAWGPISFDLCRHDDGEGERFDPARTGLDHLAFGVSSREELEAWAAWLDRNRIERSEIRDADGAGPIFDFVDPDGVQLEFFHYANG